MRELNLSKSTSCSENPVALLLKILSEEEGREIVVATKKTVLPLGLARVIASRKGYSVELLSEAGDEIRLKFKKNTCTPPSNP